MPEWPDYVIAPTYHQAESWIWHSAAEIERYGIQRRPRIVTSYTGLRGVSGKLVVLQPSRVRHAGYSADMSEYLRYLKTDPNVEITTVDLT